MAATQWATLFRQAGLDRNDAKSLAAELPALRVRANQRVDLYAAKVASFKPLSGGEEVVAKRQQRLIRSAERVRTALSTLQGEYATTQRTLGAMPRGVAENQIDLVTSLRYFEAFLRAIAKTLRTQDYPFRQGEHRRNWQTQFLIDETRWFFQCHGLESGRTPSSPFYKTLLVVTGLTAINRDTMTGRPPADEVTDAHRRPPVKERAHDRPTPIRLPVPRRTRKLQK